LPLSKMSSQSWLDFRINVSLCFELTCVLVSII